jgi:hypothetical protein
MQLGKSKVHLRYGAQRCVIPSEVIPNTYESVRLYVVSRFVIFWGG